jgi:hypothetical protein
VSDLDRLRTICRLAFDGGVVRRLRGHRLDERRLGLRALWREGRELCLRLADPAPPVDVETIRVPPADDPRFAVFVRRSPGLPQFDLVLHGSVADGTATAASDVDDLVVVRRRAFASFDDFRTARRALVRLGLLYQRIDPLQHHGHWIFTEFDLRRYDGSTMPLSVLEPGNAVAVGREVVLEVARDPASAAASRDVLHALSDDVRGGAATLFRGRANAYRLKDLLSSVSLLPAVALQCRGIELSKRAAIERARETLDARSLAVLAWSTRLRSSWGPPLTRGASLLRGLSYAVPDRRVVERAAQLLPPVPVSAARLDGLAEADFAHYVAMLEELADARPR